MKQTKIKPKEITIKQTGWRLEGIIRAVSWYNEIGTIKMDPVDISIGRLTLDTIVNSINDARFGIQGVLEANIAVFEVYDNSYYKYAGNIHIDQKTYKKHIKGGM